ncbi:VOC family protein [Nonomuraea sp. NPDC050310]|uniref:VOC family protein n=1 Tax=unclassified Nonomuraea TaxID=2593643 RepID=UPI0033F9B4FB
MAKLRHVALAVQDLEASAKFYCEAFEMEVVGETESPIASGLYLSDGTVCLALLNYKTDEAAGLERGKDYVGVHHFGFWCEDLDEQAKAITDRGGVYFMDLPLEKDSLYYEAKYRDPDGIVFDITQNGWVGARK